AEKDLTERFKAAIRKSLPQCPLIGPKWFRYADDGRRESLRFVCMGKLVKATGLKGEALADRIVKNLDLSGLDAEVKITDELEIRIRLQRSQSGSDA
ncbi:MAG TPA: hypothetical protein VM098_07440, partial [Phycisphaerae bacterium]|nr:hypothetical protein [Phycisphaerae bacterium]